MEVQESTRGGGLSGMVDRLRRRLIAGGVLGLYDPFVWWWWSEFVGEVERMDRLDAIQGVHVHAYPIHSTGLYLDCTAGWCVERLTGELETFYDHWIAGLGLGDRPVWITETGSSPWCMPDRHSRVITQVQVRDHFMAPMVAWFNGQDRYDALYWFIPRANAWQNGERRWQCSFLVDDGDTLTPLGEFWAAVQ